MWLFTIIVVIVAKIGSIEKTSVPSERLGLNKLTDQERQEMVSYDQPVISILPPFVRTVRN